MKVKKQVIEKIAWDDSSNIIDAEATIVNGYLVSLRFSYNPPGYSRKQTFDLQAHYSKKDEVPVKNSEHILQMARQIYTIVGDVLNFMEGLEGDRLPSSNDRKRKIQIREVKSSTFGDEIAEK